jgi:hypothetical protein
VKPIAILVTIYAGLLNAQNTASTGKEQWSGLSFLEGAWDAKTLGGTSGADASGSYTFRQELSGHILARHASNAGCKGPDGFDCDHGDLLYVYRDPPGQALKAIYFDNEGHVIHYSVSTPAPNTAVFIADAPAPGPDIRLVYELKGGVMFGKFQMRTPGKTEWTSYLEWSGGKR